MTQTAAADAAGVSQSVWASLEIGDSKRIGLDVAQRIVIVTDGEVTLADFPRPRGKKVKPLSIPLESTTDVVSDSAKAS